MSTNTKVKTDAVPSGGSFIAKLLPNAIALIDSADYKSTDPTPVEFTPAEGVSLMILTDVTAQSGAGNTLTLNIDFWDPAKGAFVTIASPAITLGAAGQCLVIVSPYVTADATHIVAVLPEVVRVRPVGSGTRTTLNYSVSAYLSR